jgi:hypothetical protein
MSRTLDMIADDEQALFDLLEEMGGDVTEEEAEAALDQWLAELGAERDQKLTNYARYIRVLEARADLKDEEVERLQKRGTTERARAKWMRGKLLAYLQTLQQKAIDTPLYRIARVRNGGKLPVILHAALPDIPERFQRYRIEFTVCRASLTQSARAAMDQLIREVRDCGGNALDRAEADLLTIRETLEAGEPLDFAHLGERGERLDIR